MPDSNETIGRRAFVTTAGRAALGLSALPFASCTRALKQSPTSRQDRSVDALIAELENRIPQLMPEGNVPGVSVAILRDAKLFWRRGFGVKDIVTNEPVDNDTVFEAASTSKPVFAYAVMKLCERGVMDLDTPLTKYTSRPYLEGDPRLALITARHVLAHTSGFQNFRTREEALSIHFTPGTQWSYSGEGYSYLQSVVTELVGGRVNPDDCGRYEADVDTETGDVIRHGGGNPGFACIVVASIEQKSGYVIMTNAEDIGYYNVIAKLIGTDPLASLLGNRLHTNNG
jgi:hypothetical protein